MRSLNLRRGVIAAALVVGNGLFIGLRPGSAWPLKGGLDWLDQIDESIWSGDNIFAVIGERWVGCGEILLPVLTTLAVAALCVRLVARQRLRVTGADPLEPSRRWVARKRWVIRALCGAPALLTLDGRLVGESLEVLSVGQGHHDAWKALTLLALGIVAPMLGVAAALRGSLGALLAPLLDDAEPKRTNAGGSVVSAVVVTPKTRAVVGGFALISLLLAGVLALLSTTTVAASAYCLWIVLAYAVSATLGAWSFVRGARIALGLDGVRVSLSSRGRFHAYRDFDGVDVTRSGDILLRADGKVALRIQLHGEDAARHESIVERLRAAIAGARAPGGDAHRLAAAASPALLLAQAARGDGEYRSPAATRDAVWELVEGPWANGDARTRAARALVAGADGADRARLRLAAERCADPPTRRELLRIAVEGDEQQTHADAEAPLRRAVLHTAER